MKKQKSQITTILVLAAALAAPHANAATIGERLLRGLFGGKDKKATAGAAPVETARASLLEELTKAKEVEAAKKPEVPKEAEVSAAAGSAGDVVVPRIEGRIIRGTEKNPTRVILVLDQSDSTKEPFDGSTRAATIAKVANKAIRTLIENNSDNGIPTDRVEIAVIGYNRGVKFLLNAVTGSAFVSLSELDGKDLPKVEGVTQWITPVSVGGTNTDLAFKEVQKLIHEKLALKDGQKKLFLIAHLTDAELGSDPTDTIQEIVASVNELEEDKKPKGQIVVTNAQISSSQYKPIFFGTAAETKEVSDKVIADSTALSQRDQAIAKERYAEKLLQISSPVPRRRIAELGATEENFMFGYGITDAEKLLQILVAGTNSQGGR